jgi:hypothetical protein
MMIDAGAENSGNPGGFMALKAQECPMRFMARRKAAILALDLKQALLPGNPGSRVQNHVPWYILTRLAEKAFSTQLNIETLSWQKIHV